MRGGFPEDLFIIEILFPSETISSTNIGQFRQREAYQQYILEELKEVPKTLGQQQLQTQLLQYQTPQFKTQLAEHKRYKEQKLLLEMLMQMSKTPKTPAQQDLQVYTLSLLTDEFVGYYASFRDNQMKNPNPKTHHNQSTHTLQKKYTLA